MKQSRFEKLSDIKLMSKVKNYKRVYFFFAIISILLFLLTIYSVRTPKPDLLKSLPSFNFFMPILTIFVLLAIFNLINWLSITKEIKKRRLKN